MLAFTLAESGAFLALAAAAAVAWLIFRGGGATALATLSEANRVLERRVADLERTNRAQELEIAELRGRTDYVSALSPVLAEIRELDEIRQKQFDATLALLDMIAARIGPDKNGVGE